MADSDWKQYLDITNSFADDSHVPASKEGLRQPLAENLTRLTATPQQKLKRPAQWTNTPSSIQQNVLRRRMDELDTFQDFRDEGVFAGHGDLENENGQNLDKTHIGGTTPTRPNSHHSAQVVRLGFDSRPDSSTPDTIVSLRNGIGMAARKIEEEKRRSDNPRMAQVVPSSDIDDSLDDVHPKFEYVGPKQHVVSLEKLVHLKNELVMKFKIRELKETVDFLELERTFERGSILN
ncbi:unnamed protein product [Kuraishia capsulata CBS 1993]|uniref:Uncharacterized protein n=1 Tax=Kuraishia capsulata CBS 1993 TaxID=1382522 RepID=W6MJM7_9ASCO|nr:uncharacterized protein KUCA_T00002154001 [Kuraishia capsulata CBS 1993]CDK26183.1 unnamed protein product [Kuraishia capsulata CBS 1993]